MFGKSLRVIKTGRDRVGSRLILSSIRIAYSGISIGQNVFVGSKCRIRASDSGILVIGDKTTVESICELTAKGGNLAIGRNAFIGRGAIIVCRHSITIGDDVLIAEYVTIRDQDHRYGGPMATALNGFETAPIVIGNNVWIGAKATITRGVTIGDNSVIGANSVVTRDVPANVVVAGMPAKVLRSIEVGPVKATDQARADQPSASASE